MACSSARSSAGPTSRASPASSATREPRCGAATPGYVGASRSLIVGTSKEAAATAARGYLEKTFTMYRTWQMQEPTMGRLQLGFETSLDDWTIHGSPKDCVEAIERARTLGLERIGFTIYSLPADVKRADRLPADDRRAHRGAGARCA